MKARIIKIDIKQNGPLWNATSADIPGLRVTEYSRAEAIEQVSLAIELLLEGWSAHPLEPENGDDLRWVAVPPREAAAA